jgi:hypothetical protein
MGIVAFIVLLHQERSTGGHVDEINVLARIFWIAEDHPWQGQPPRRGYVDKVDVVERDPRLCDASPIDWIEEAAASVGACGSLRMFEACDAFKTECIGTRDENMLMFITRMVSRTMVLVESLQSDNRIKRYDDSKK